MGVMWRNLGDVLKPTASCYFSKNTVSPDYTQVLLAELEKTGRCQLATEYLKVSSHWMIMSYQTTKAGGRIITILNNPQWLIAQLVTGRDFQIPAFTPAHKHYLHTWSASELLCKPFPCFMILHASFRVTLFVALHNR